SISPSPKIRRQPAPVSLMRARIPLCSKIPSSPEAAEQPAKARLFPPGSILRMMVHAIWMAREFPIRLAAHQQSDENGVARFHRRQRSDVYLVPRVRKGVRFECPAAPQSVAPTHDLSTQ